MNYPRYPEYKPSGVEWLGEVPGHWEVKRLKFAAACINDKQDQPPENSGYVAMEHIESWTGKRLDIENGITPESQTSRFQKDDVLFGKLRPYLAKSWLADRDGACSTELLVLRGRELDPAYLRYWTLMRPFVEVVDGSTYGSKMPRANWDFIGNMLTSIPHRDEQHAIAAFLDRETARIDALIEKKRRFIELLQEKRAALISRAVTRGLDPNVPLKESGVEWLGQIPAHWEVKRLKFGMTRIEQGWSPLCENALADEDQWGVLKVGCVNGDAFDEAESKTLPADIEPLTEYEIKVGDVLMSRANTRELLGSAALVKSVRPRLLLCDKLYRLRLQSWLDSAYLVYALRSVIARFQYERDSTGASGSMQNIGQDTVKELVLAFPPKEEQRSIPEALDRESARLDMLRAKVESAIEKLKEYRAALIAAAVTGKIDVRET